MRKYLSSLIYLVVTLTAILLLLPFILGLITENRCKKMVEVINNITPINIKIVDYKRGWFNSKAIAHISPDKLDFIENQIIATANITHGPLIIDWARFYFAQATINTKIESNIIPNLATSNIKLELNGNIDIKLNSRPLTYPGENISFNWQGLKTKLMLSPSYNVIQASTEFSGLDVKTKERSFQLGKITSTHQEDKSIDSLRVGRHNLQIESLAIQSIYDRIMAFKKINFTGQGKINKKNLVDIDVAITINNININGGIYTQNALDIELNNLSQKALTKISQQYIPNKILTSPTSFGLDIATALLNNGGEINIKKLNTNTPWGKTIAAIKIAFPEESNNILSMIAGITIETNIKAKRALVLHLLEKFYQNFPTAKEKKDPATQAKNLLDDWQESGKIFTESDDDYLNINFDYKNNQLLINNNPLILTTKP